MASVPLPKTPVILICGEDDFGVKQRAREVFRHWSEASSGADQELIDASVSNSAEAVKALARLREALQTLPFFGGAKLIWFQNCNFLAEDRTSSAAIVTETLAEMGQELKTFEWGTVRLLISAGKVDRRKSFYKTLEKIGTVELLASWSDDKNWVDQAEAWAWRALQGLQKEISEEALARLVANVGPNNRLLASEVEKLATYVGERAKIQIQDVEAIVTRSKQACAFALGDALGDRNLSAVLRCLDEELWEVRRDPQRNEIGLLFGLITKVRVLIFVKELIAQRLLSANERDFNRFKTQLARVPADALPEDKKFNPLALNPYVLFRALGQAKNYSQSELIQAMELLLGCNLKMVSRSLDPSMLLQQALIEIVNAPAQKERAAHLA